MPRLDALLLPFVGIAQDRGNEGEMDWFTCISSDVVCEGIVGYEISPSLESFGGYKRVGCFGLVVFVFDECPYVLILSII